MAEVAAGGGEGFRELRWLNLAGSLEEKCGEDERLEKADVVGGENAGCEGLEAPRGAVDGKHGTFAKEGIDAHVV